MLVVDMSSLQSEHYSISGPGYRILQRSGRVYEGWFWLIQDHSTKLHPTSKESLTSFIQPEPTCLVSYTIVNYHGGSR